MAGFLPVGSFPVASVPTGEQGNVYNIDVGNAEARGYDYTFTYVFQDPTRVSWIGAEVLHVGDPYARVSWIGAEVLHPGEPAARVSWIGIEVLRSIEDFSSTDDAFVFVIW